MKIRHALLAVAGAWTVAATAQAAPITYAFGGTLSFITPPLPTLAAVGDAFAGTFSIESTAANLSSFSDFGEYAVGYSMDVTVNGNTYSSSNTASECCGGVVVHFNGGYSSFGVTSDLGLGIGFSGLGPTSVSGPSVNGMAPSRMLIDLADSGTYALNSTAIPSSLTLSSFDSRRTFILFLGNSSAFVLGNITYLTQLTAAPVPEASTSAMLTLGLGVLAWARRRQRS